MTDIIDFKKPKTVKFRTRVMILASSLDCTIGKDNDIPWDCKTDMKFFKRATIGNVVIMGRKTFESMKSKPLYNRVNIVISKTIGQESVPEGVIVVTNYIDAITTARLVDLSAYDRNTVDEHIFIIGGVQIYEHFINNVDEVLWSTIDVNCGPNGYGSEFINNSLSTKFELNPNYASQLIYLNHNAVTDAYPCNLREIVHFYKTTAHNKLTFKKV